MGSVMQLKANQLPQWLGCDRGFGYGDGSGCGFDNGNGFGYGSGYGNGDGNGYGYGDGYSYGRGFDDGDGNGNICGDGYGADYGDGYGFGYGKGEKGFWLSAIAYFAARLPEAQQARLSELRASGATIAIWRSNSQGCATNGGRNDPVKPGTIETAPGPLELCGAGTLHATLSPYKWRGERWWIVAMIGETVEDSAKIGALKREIIGECL